MPPFLYFVNEQAHTVASMSGEKKPAMIALLESAGFRQCDHVEYLLMRYTLWADETHIDIESDEHKKKKSKSNANKKSTTKKVED